jgi:multiple sugar transport system substrate-binding protein
MKWIYGNVVMLLVVSLVLSACGGQPTVTTDGTKATEVVKATEVTKATEVVKATEVTKATETTAPPQPVSAQKVKIRGTVWVSQEELDALNKLTDPYLKAHPNVEIEWININGGGPYGRDKLQTMIAGNDAPDLMMLNTGQFEGFAARGALLDLGPYVTKENFDTSIFWDIGIEGSKYNGKLYGLPRDIGDDVLFYNKDLFDAAKLEYPNANWTFDDLQKASEKLTIDKNGDGKIDQWGFAVVNQVWAWANLVWANGGEVLTPDRKQCKLTDPKSVEALEFYYETLGKSSPPPGAMPEQSFFGTWFQTESVAMAIAGPWFRPVVVSSEKKFRWDVALLPLSPTTKQRATVAYTDQWGIYAKTQQPDQTWDFVKYLTSKEGQELWVKLIGARSISPVKEVAQTDAWLHYGGSSGEIILDELSVSRVPPVNFANANEVETIWDSEFDSVVAGEKTIKVAVVDACKAIQPVLDGTQ